MEQRGRDGRAERETKRVARRKIDRSEGSRTPLENEGAKLSARKITRAGRLRRLVAELRRVRRGLRTPEETYLRTGEIRKCRGAGRRL